RAREAISACHCEDLGLTHAVVVGDPPPYLRGASLLRWGGSLHLMRWAKEFHSRVVQPFHAPALGWISDRELDHGASSARGPLSGPCRSWSTLAPPSGAQTCSRRSFRVLEGCLAQSPRPTNAGRTSPPAEAPPWQRAAGTARTRDRSRR